MTSDNLSKLSLFRNISKFLNRKSGPPGWLVQLANGNLPASFLSYFLHSLPPTRASWIKLGLRVSDLGCGESKPNTVYLINAKSQKLTSMLLRLWSKCESTGWPEGHFQHHTPRGGGPEIWHRWGFAVSRFKEGTVRLEMLKPPSHQRR